MSLVDDVDLLRTFFPFVLRILCGLMLLISKMYGFDTLHDTIASFRSVLLKFVNDMDGKRERDYHECVLLLWTRGNN